MFCQQCGTQIEDGLAFCTNCGAKQEAVTDVLVNNEVIHPVQPQPVVNEPYVQPVNPQGYVQPVNPYNQPVTPQGYVQPNVDVPKASASGSPKKVSFGEAIKLYFVNYVNFSGRSTASEYWFAYLFNFLVSLCTSWIPYVGQIISFGLLIPGLSLSVRRLHDTGKSWVYLLMGLIPFAGIVILIIRYCKPSDVDNKWGPAPRD